MKKLQSRMLLFILVPTLLFFIGTILYVSYSVQNIAQKQAEQTLKTEGEALANQLRIELETTLASLETISTYYASTIENGDKPDRDEANLMLQGLLTSNSNFLSAWMFWEENAFDGEDEKFKNKAGHDQTGRFIPVWSMDNSGRTYLEPVREYTDGGDVQANLESVLNSGEKTIYEPFHYEFDGEDILITSIVVPVIVDGKVVGMTGVDVSLQQMHDIVSSYTFYETGFAGLMTSNGGVISHNNEEIIGGNYFETEAVQSHKHIDQVSEAVRVGEPYMITGFSNALQTDVYRLFSPIKINGVTAPWSAFLAAPVNEVMKDAKSVTTTTISLGVVVAIVLAAIILFVTRTIVRPIQLVATQMERVAHGDLSQEPLTVKAKDETGQLANALNEMQEGLKIIVANIINASSTISTRSEELTQAAHEVSEGSEQIATTMQELASGTETQANHSSDLASTITSFVAKIDETNNNGEMIQQASQQVLELTDQGAHLMRESTKQMDIIDKIVHDAVDKVEGLDTHTQDISQLVNVIHDIAEQTNLLALNAAIEAARAGEHGQGFAVVADEVRKLAEQSSASVSDITDIVARIQAESSSVVNSLREGYGQVEQGTEQISTTEETFAEINRAITDMVQRINEVSDNLADVLADGEEMSSAIEDIAAVSEESAAGVEETTATTEQSSAAMEQVASNSRELARLAEELNKLIVQFKI